MLRILSLTSCLLISIISFADDQPENREAEIIQALTDLSAQLPQQYLSLDAVAEHNEYDENRIIKWVADNIQYSPSPGYQLTPENALLTATGNALEQAMLLQNILTQAGFEVRISRADLDEETAIELLKQSFFASSANQWQFDDGIRDEYLKKFASLYGKEESALLERYQELDALTPWVESGLYTESKELSETLYAAIEKKGAWQFSNDPFRPWIQIAQDYYFVKYRLSQGDEWMQAHPAFVENTPIIETSTYFTDDISSQYHQITLQAFITRQIEGKEKEIVAVTPPIRRTSQQLFKRQLAIMTTPSNFSEALEAKSLALLYEGKYFVPFVDGDLEEETRVFSLDGQDYAATDVLDSTQVFLNAVNDKSTAADSALGKLLTQESEVTPDLSNESSSVLLDYHFLVRWTAPNGDTREIKRVIYQKKKNDTHKSIVEDISQRVLLAAEPGVLSEVALSRLQLQAQIAMFELQQKYRQQDFSEAQAVNQVYQLYQSQKDIRFNNTLALSRQFDGNQRSFSSAPMLAMIWERDDYNSEDSSGTSIFDFLINATHVVGLADGELILDRSATLAHGVWSTYGEALVQAKNGQEEGLLSRLTLPPEVISAAGQFNLATIDGGEFEIVTNASQLGAFRQLRTSVRESLSLELNTNPQYLYVVPTEKPSAGYFSYYRVNSQTGETLGYSEFGRGQASVEYLNKVRLYIRVYVIGISAAKCVTGLAGSVSSGSAGSDTSKKAFSCLLCTAVKGGFSLVNLGKGATPLTKVAGDFVGASCATSSILD